MRHRDCVDKDRGSPERQVRIAPPAATGAQLGDDVALLGTEATSIALVAEPKLAEALGSIRKRVQLLGLRFPRLSQAQLGLLTEHIQLAMGDPTASPRPLPPQLFSALFYTGCTRCGAELTPDADGVFHCTECFREMRLSQIQAVAEGGMQLQRMWRDAYLIVRDDAPEEGNEAASTPGAQERQLLACHAALAELFGHIDPVCLLDAPGSAPSLLTAGASHALTLHQVRRLHWFRVLGSIILLPSAQPSSVWLTLDSAADPTHARAEGGQRGGSECRAASAKEGRRRKQWLLQRWKKLR